MSDEIVLAQARVALRAGLHDQAIRCGEIVAGRAPDAATRCEALRLLSNACRLECLWDRALDAARRESSEAEAAGLPDQVAEGLNAEAGVHLARGDLEAARPLLHRALGTAAAPRLLGVLWQNLGALEAQARSFDAATDAFARSLRYFEEAGDQWGSACTLINTGCLHLDRGELKAAADLFAGAITAGRAANDLDLVAGAMMNRARALFQLGELDDAEFSASSAAGFYVSANMSLRYAECLIVLGDIERARGQESIAMRCYRRGLDTVEPLGAAGLVSELRERVSASSQS